MYRRLLQDQTRDRIAFSVCLVLRIIAGPDAKPTYFLGLMGLDSAINCLNVSDIALLLMKASTYVRSLNPDR